MPSRSFHTAAHPWICCLAAGKLLGDSDRPLDVRIKWPNDLYAGAHKLGGILCQTVYRDRQFQVSLCKLSG